jgi:hypothetical protein
MLVVAVYSGVLNFVAWAALLKENDLYDSVQGPDRQIR